MTTNDERDATKALAHRLTEWGVDGAVEKASKYVSDLVSHGWRMSANEPRTIRRPPMKSEECATHEGEYRDLCRGCASDRHAARDLVEHGPKLSEEEARAALRATVTAAARPKES